MSGGGGVLTMYEHGYDPSVDLGRKWPGGTQNRCFWASGSASLPETGAKRRGATPRVL